MPCSLSPLISCIHSSLFSDWRHTVSSKSFDTLVPSISIDELVLLHHACCVLSHLRCNRHSLLLSFYLSRISRIKNPSYSACGHPSQDISHLILHCPQRTLCVACSLAIFCLSTTSGPGPGKSPGLWGSMVFSHQPIPGKGSSNNNNNNSKTEITDALLRNKGSWQIQTFSKL